MTRAWKGSIPLPVLLVVLPLMAIVLSGLAVHFVFQRSHREQNTTAHLIALWTNRDGYGDARKAAALTPHAIQYWIYQGADINAKDPYNQTALYEFSLAHNLDVVKLLLSQGGDVRDHVHWGYRGWFVKSEETSWLAGQIMTASVGRTDIVQMLLDRGVDINIRDVAGQTALSRTLLSGSDDMVQFLVEKGADANVRYDDFGDTPLMRVAGDGKADLVTVLLSHGADVNAKNIEGDTPLMKAANAKVAQMLIAREANVNAKDFKGRSVLEFARHRGNTAIIKLLQAAGAK